MRTVVRARTDEKIRDEATAVPGAVGLTVSDAFCLMMVRIAADKRLPFEPLVPNDETIEAMKAARRGESVPVGVRPGRLPRLSIVVPMHACPVVWMETSCRPVRILRGSG